MLKYTRLTLFFGLSALLLCSVACKDVRKSVPRENINLTHSVDIFETPLIPSPNSIPGHNVVAIVNGQEIHHHEVEREAMAVAARMRLQLPPERIAQERDKHYKQALNNVIVQKLLFFTNDAEVIQADPSEVNRTLTEIKSNLPGNTTFNDFLQQAGITEAALVETIELELRMRAVLLQNIGDQPAPSEKDVQTFYESNQAQFRAPDRVTADYVVVPTPAGSDANQTVHQQQLAVQVKDSLSEGKPVTEILSQVSETNRVQGGSGIFLRGQLDKNFEDALFTLKTNQTSEIISTDAGLHIFRAEKISPAGILPIDEVQERIAAVLTHRETQTRINQYISDLRDKADIQILP